MAGELILVVDDDPDIVEVLCCTLHDAGYEVATADADAAVHVAHERRPRVILLDLVRQGEGCVGVGGCHLIARVVQEAAHAPRPRHR